MDAFERLALTVKEAAQTDEIKKEIEHNPTMVAAHVQQKLKAMGMYDLAHTLHVVPPRSLDRLKDFITVDPDTLRLLDEVVEMCEDEDSVLIHGETGTGKEIIAAALHGRKPLDKFIAINTTSLTDTLLESELFGHVKGAFSGATEDRVGKLVAADKGTVFLDEIGDMRANMQEKLLRALQEHTVTPVGSNKEIPFNCRVIAATHKVIRQEIAIYTEHEAIIHVPCEEKMLSIMYCPVCKRRAIAARFYDEPCIHQTNKVLWLKSFREDLYWRLATYVLHIKPLRQRMCDIKPIINNLFADKIHLLSDEFIESLITMPLTGNVRELINRCKNEMFKERFELKYAKKYLTTRVERHLKSTPHKEVMDILGMDNAQGNDTI